METVHNVYLIIKQTKTYGNVIEGTFVPLLFICHWLLTIQGRHGYLFMYEQNPVSLNFMWHSPDTQSTLKLVYNFDNYLTKCSSYTTSVKQSQPHCWSITAKLTQIPGPGQGIQYPAIRM